MVFEVHERLVRDSETEPYSMSQSVDVRDQSVQSGNGNVRRPNSKKANSKAGPGKFVSNPYSSSYVSPFIQSAERRAIERARQYAADKLKKPKPDWNSEASPRGNLFDPTIHKEDIFKLRPRIPPSKKGTQQAQETTEHTRSNTLHQENDAVRVGRIDMKSRPKMTLRSSAVRIFEIVCAFCHFLPLS